MIMAAGIPELAATGVDALPFLLVALAFIVAGGVVLVVRRIASRSTREAKHD